MTLAFSLSYILIIVGLILLIRKPRKSKESKIILLSLEIILVILSMLLFKYFSSTANKLDTTFSLIFTIALLITFILSMLQILLYNKSQKKSKK